MTVQELIDALMDVDPNLEVRVWYDTPIESVEVELPSFVSKESYLQIHITHYCGT